MLDELSRKSRRQANEVFTPLDHHAAIGSILIGLTDSSVYVDNKDEPKCALTWTKSRIFLSGELNDEDNRRTAETIREKIRLDSLHLGAKYFVLYFDTKMSPQDLLELLDGVKAHPDTRNYYELDARTREWGEAERDWFRLEVIDRRFLDRKSVV